MYAVFNRVDKHDSKEYQTYILKNDSSPPNYEAKTHILLFKIRSYVSSKANVVKAKKA